MFCISSGGLFFFYKCCIYGDKRKQLLLPNHYLNQFCKLLLKVIRNITNITKPQLANSQQNHSHMDEMQIIKL